MKLTDKQRAYAKEGAQALAAAAIAFKEREAKARAKKRAARRKRWWEVSPKMVACG